MKNRKNPEDIFNTALGLFAYYGYRKTTVEDVARALEMTKGNLYLYVSGKKDLYEKSVRHGMLKWQNRVASEVRRHDNPEEQLLVLCRTAYTYLAEDEDLQKVLMNDPTIFPISSEEDRFKDINDASIEMLKSVISGGIEKNKFRECDVTRVAEFLFSVYVMFIIKSYIKSEKNSTTELFTEGLNLILSGLLKH